MARLDELADWVRGQPVYDPQVERVLRRGALLRRRRRVLAGAAGLALAVGLAASIQLLPAAPARVDIGTPTQTATPTARPAAVITEPAVGATVTIGTGPRAIPPPPAASAWCSDQWLFAVATTVDGELEAWCADGTIIPITQGDVPHRHPTIGSDLVVAERRATNGTAELISYDLETGQPAVLWPGTTPALSITGALAWAVEERTGEALIVHVTERLGSGAGSQLPVPTPPDASLRLSWDRDGRWLFASLASPTGASALAFTAADWALPPTPLDGGVLAATTGERDTPDAAALLVRPEDGPLTIVGALMNSVGPPATPSYASVAHLEVPIDSFNPHGALTIESISLATYYPAEGWASGSTISWLIGDGTAVWHQPSGHNAIHVRDGVTEVAANPAFVAATNI